MQRGLISSDEAETMSLQETINLVLLPGFSTRDQVTSLSGRGVGMDVVKRNIEAIGGSLDIYSEVGQGTRVRIELLVAQEGEGREMRGVKK